MTSGKNRLAQVIFGSICCSIGKVFDQNLPKCEFVSKFFRLTPPKKELILQADLMEPKPIVVLKFLGRLEFHFYVI